MHEISGAASRVRIYVGEADHVGGRPLAHALVLEARRVGLAGATVLRAVEGYGASSRLRSAEVLDLSTDLPVVVEIVDADDRIDAALDRLLALVEGGLVTRESVTVLKYAHGRTDRG